MITPERMAARTERTQQQGRAWAEVLMADACTITREPETEWVRDPVTGRDVPAERTEVYAGRCKVQTHAPYEITPDVGGATETVQRYVVHVPVGAGPVAIGDQVTVTSQGDRVFRIAGTHRKTFQTAQRLLVDELH